MGVADLPRTAGRFQTGQVADFTEIRNIVPVYKIKAIVASNCMFVNHETSYCLFQIDRVFNLKLTKK